MNIISKISKSYALNYCQYWIYIKNGLIILLKSQLENIE
jgi:hypothetical protein